MPKGIKQSFLLYHDQCEIFDELTDEQAGKLIKEIVLYARSKKASASNCKQKKAIALDGLLKALAKPVLASIDRDTETWHKISKERAANGKKGGRGNKKEGEKKQVQAKKAVTVTVTDTVTDNLLDKSNKKNNYEQSFEKFYSQYPNKKAKDKARQAFIKKMEEGVKLDDIFLGLENYKKEIQIKQTERSYIAHPSTWLNQGRWQDDYETAQTPPSKESFTEREAKRFKQQYNIG